MVYTTQAELIQRYGENELKELTDRDNSGSIDSTVVDKAIADAENEINSYLGARYALPIVGTVPSLSLAAADIARFLLHENRATTEVAERYAIRIEWLKMVAAGKAKLVDDNNQAIQDPGVSTSLGPVYKSNGREFTDETMAGF